MLEQMNEIRGRKLIDINVGTPILDLLLSFEGNYKLRTFSHSTHYGENWELRHQSGLRIAMREGTVCDWVEYMETPDKPSA